MAINLKLWFFSFKLVFIYGCLSLIKYSPTLTINDSNDIQNKIKGAKPAFDPISRETYNTFILNVAVNQSTNRDYIKTQVHDKVLAFEKDMNQAHIKFAFLSIHYLAFQGFTIVLDNPEEIIDIENLHLTYITHIQADFKVSIMNHEAITAFPQYAMNVPFKETHAFMSGKNIKVAVLDQGIDPFDPTFQIPGKVCNNKIREGCRVKRIYDLGELQLYSGSAIRRRRTDGLTECINWDKLQMYGTHGMISAGLIGGTDTRAPGIAQEVSFYDFRIIDSNGYAPFFICLIGIEGAIADDVDIIYTGWGQPGSTANRFPTNFKKKDGKSDILLIAPIGNEGESHLLFQASQLSQFTNMISVGSVKNPFSQFFFMSFNTDTRLGPHQLDVFEIQSLHLTSELQQALKQSQQQAIVVMDKQSKPIGKPFSLHETNSVLLFLICSDQENCVDQLFSTFVEMYQPLSYIFVCENEMDWTQFLGKGLPIGKITTKVNEFKEMISIQQIDSFSFFYQYQLDQSMGLVPSEFTSMGPSALLNIEPHITAIGENIMAYAGRTADTHLPNYLMVSGTSYAAAKLTGILCGILKLYHDKERTINFNEILNKLMNTAEPYIFPSTLPMVNTNPSFYPGFAHTVLQQGAGLVNIHAILNTHVYISPPSLSFELPSNVIKRENTRTHSFSITNNGGNTKSFQVSHIPTLGFYYDEQTHRYEVMNIILGGAVQISDQLYDSNLLNNVFVHVLPYSSLEIKVTLTMDNTGHPLPPRFHAGYFKFTPIFFTNDASIEFSMEDGAHVLSLPYVFTYMKKNYVPFIDMRPLKSGFLTDLNILNVIEYYLDLPRPSTLFPIYQGEASPFPVFSFMGTSKPVVSLCIIFPLNSVNFYLFNFFDSEDRLGFLQSFYHIEPGCYLFFLQTKPYKYKNHLDLHQLRNTDEPRGWDGRYKMARADSESVTFIKPGNYRICLKGKQVGRDASKVNYHWCSTPFQVINTQLHVSNSQ